MQLWIEHVQTLWILQQDRDGLLVVLPPNAKVVGSVDGNEGTLTPLKAIPTEVQKEVRSVPNVSVYELTPDNARTHKHLFLPAENTMYWWIMLDPKKEHFDIAISIDVVSKVRQVSVIARPDRDPNDRQITLFRPPPTWTVTRPKSRQEALERRPSYDRGRRDGEAGKSPTDATDEYLAGYTSGRKQFLESHT